MDRCEVVGLEVGVNELGEGVRFDEIIQKLIIEEINDLLYYLESLCSHDLGHYVLIHTKQLW